MGSFVYFLVLAIVSLTGRIVASSHSARRRRLEGVSEKGIRKKLFDEKQAIRESLDGARSPSLPMFRIRRTLLGPGAFGLLEGSLKEKEDILAQRRNLKKTLRIVIPSGEIMRVRPHASEIPSSFNFYAEHRAPHATSLLPVATAKTTPKLETSLTRDHSTSMLGKATPMNNLSVSGVHDPEAGWTDASGDSKLRARPRGIARVGMLRVERVEKQWRASVGFVGDA